jgi:hypothetical protein
MESAGWLLRPKPNIDDCALRMQNPRRMNAGTNLDKIVTTDDIGTICQILLGRNVGTLKYSCKSLHKVVWEAYQESWTRLHEEAIRMFGG